MSNPAPIKPPAPWAASAAGYAEGTAARWSLASGSGPGKREARAALIAELRAIPQPHAAAVGFYLGHYSTPEHAASLGRWLTDDL